MMSSPLAPRIRKSIGVGSAGGLPGSSGAGTPVTPRTRTQIIRTPDSSPAFTLKNAFDRKGGRSSISSPLTTPLRVKQLKRSDSSKDGPLKRVIRKRGWSEKIADIPSDIMFQISLFPDNVPLPQPKTSAQILGGFMHLIHFLVRISASRKAIEDAAPWEDYVGETESWFDWTVPVSTALLLASFYTSFRLFTSFKSYHLYLQKDPVSSPRAAFVSRNLNREPVEGPTLTRLVVAWMGQQFSASWRFLFNMKPSPQRLASISDSEKVQELNVWNPGKLESHLFTIYSPVHAFLWMATNFSNWILMFIIMAIVSTQTSILKNSYEGLLKDKQIIHAEVLNEYDKKFVNPRIFYPREDKGVMTNEAEMVFT